MSGDDIAMRATLDTSGAASGFQQLNGHLSDFGLKTQTASASLGPLGTVLGSMASPMTAVALGITAIGGALMTSVQAASAWETSMSGVAKTSGLSGTALESMSQQLLTMSTEMPITAAELAKLSGAAGSLGVGASFAEKGDYQGQADAMAEFAVVASKMGIGFGMAADEAATAGAKILNSFGKDMDSSNMEKLGSVVNSMGDNFAATEVQVLDFLNRASFLNSTFGQTIPQVAALGTTLISTGLDSEVAATGIKSLINMGTSVSSKTGGLDNWAKLLGTSVTDLKQKMGTDLNGTLIETANKIVAINDPVERFQAAVALAGTEGAPALLKLAGQQENYNKALGMSSSEWEKASSLQKTYEAQSSTMGSQWTMFTNTLTMAGTQLGTVMLPAATSFVGFMTDSVKEVIKLGDAFGTAWEAGKDLLGSGAETVVGAGQGLSSLVGGYNEMESPEFKARIAAMGTQEGKIKAEEEIKAADQVKRANEAISLAEEEARAAAEGEARAKASAEAQKKWLDANAGYLEAGMAKLVGGGYMSWDAINQAKSAANGNRSQGHSGLFGRNDVSLIQEDEGVKYEIRSQATKSGTDVSLWVDGQKMAEGSGYGSKEEAIRDLFNQGGFPLSEAVSLNLQGRPGDAAKIKVSESTEIEYDYNAVYENIKPVSQYFNDAGMTATALKDVLQLYVNTASSAGKEAATKFAEDFAAGMAAPDWSNLPEMQAAGDALQDYYTKNFMPGNADLIAAQFQQYKNILFDQITDVKEFAKDKGSEVNKALLEAFSDHSFDENDKAILAAMIPGLQLIVDESPKYAAEAGLDFKLAFLNYAVFSGADTDQILAQAKKLKQNLVEEVGGNWLGKTKWEPIKVADLLNTDDITKKLVDVQAYVQNSFLPEMTTAMKEAREGFNSGTTTGEDLYDSYVRPLEKIGQYLPIWLQDLMTKYEQGGHDFKAFLDGFDMSMDLATKKVEDQTVGYDNLKAAIGDCAECAISEFGAWQEAQDSLFSDSYIGAGGSAYVAWKNEQMQSVANTQAGMTATSGAVMDTYLQLNTTEAETIAGAFKTEILNMNPQMHIVAKVDRTDLDNCIRFVTMAHHMPVIVDVSANAGQIYAIVQQAVAEAISSVA